jgi:replicative DNA helicase
MKAAPPLTEDTPQDLEAERAVLGAMMIDKTVLADIMPFVCEKHFYDLKNAIIWRHMVKIASRGETPDLVNLPASLRDAGELESAGDYLYIVGLENAIIATSAAREWAERVQEMSRRRQLQRIGLDMAASAASGDESEEIARRAATRITETIAGTTSKTTHRSETALPETLQYIEDVTEKRHRGEVVGLPTGLSRLDKALGGLQPGQLVILAAGTSIGKTALALNVFHHTVFHQRQSAIYCSLEMNKDALNTRLFCIHADLDADRVRKGFASKEELEDLRRVENDLQTLGAPHIIHDSGTLGAAEFRVFAEMDAQALGGVALIVVDGLWLMTHEREKGQNEAQVVARTSRAMKQAAMDLGVPILLLHQLNRGVKGERPTLARLRDSGAIEQDADVVIFLDRKRQEASSAGPDDSISTTDVIIAKQRNGPVDTVQCAFDLRSQRFRDYDRGWGEEQG